MELIYPYPRIVVLVSHLQQPSHSSALTQMVRVIANEYADESTTLVIDTSVENALSTARKLEKNSNADLFICAGATAEHLRQNLERPIISMRVGLADILRAMAKALHHSTKIAVISYKQVNTELSTMSEFFTCELIQAAYTTLDGARNAVMLAKDAGCDVVIGSSTVLDIASQAGLKSILSLSKNTVRTAFEEANGLFHSQRIDNAKKRHLDAVIKHIKVGVAAIDNTGTIQSINPALSSILSIPPEAALGKPLKNLCPTLDLEEALSVSSGEENKIIRMGSNTVVGNVLPIIEEDQRTGILFTCQEISEVQRADQRIRRSRHGSTFVARYTLDQIEGRSQTIKNLIGLARRYASTNSTVLITGESGTGKELLAQGIHNLSNRHDYPFVAINCAAFPETLLESELFGYAEGAFSGSRKGGKAGLFEVAHRGTLFLDEIGDMPISLQTRLLRVLQEREVIRLGNTEPTAIDVRVIAATHQDLATAIQGDRFRADLYYRLNILRLQTIPLRERAQDIPLIIDNIVQRVGFGEIFPAALLPLLMSHTWPGNVRELENIVERILISKHELIMPDGAVDEAHLAYLIPELLNLSPNPTKAAMPSFDLRASSKAVELQILQTTLERCNGDMELTASKLGISRTTLWRRLRDAKVEQG